MKMGDGPAQALFPFSSCPRELEFQGSQIAQFGEPPSLGLQQPLQGVPVGDGLGAGEVVADVGGGLAVNRGLALGRRRHVIAALAVTLDDAYDLR